MTVSPLGSYLPGDSTLHRIRPGAKLLGLCAFSVAAVAFRSPLGAAIALAAGLTLALIAGMRRAELWRATRGFLLIGCILFLFATVNGTVDAARGAPSGPPSAQDWLSGAAQGFAVVGTLLALILAASAVTASTPVDRMLDTIAWALSPLRRLGVRPERAALAFSLAITAIPRILGLARETREAARARGLGRDPRALAIPLVLRTVAHAQSVGEALAARGIGDDERPRTP